MPATLSIFHPNISTFPTTLTSQEVNVLDTTINVQNSSDFSVNNYVLVGPYGGGTSQIIQITAPNPSINALTTGASAFPYNTNQSITVIPFNTINIYRSTTGLGGAYTLLTSVPIQVDQNLTTYTDFSAISPYSYRYTFYNSVLNAESDFSSEVPYGGFPPYSVYSIVDSVIKLFGDTLGQIVSRDMIVTWLNWLIGEMMTDITSGQSPYYVTSYVLTTTGAESYDLSAQGMIFIIKVEYSLDGGITYKADINPQDFRSNGYDSDALYSYSFAGSSIFLKDSGNNYIAAGNFVRIWAYTNQTQLVNDSDNLPDPMKPYVGFFVDYLLMRCNQVRGKIVENAAYFENRNRKDKATIVSTIKQRIRQPGMQEPSLYNSGYGYPY